MPHLSFLLVISTCPKRLATVFSFRPCSTNFRIVIAFDIQFYDADDPSMDVR
jgi:hypothetical protein